MVVILPVRTADQRRRLARDLGNRLVALRHVRDDLVGGQRVIVVVLARMVLELMPRLHDGFGRIGILLRPRADHEKRCFHAVFVQYVQNLLRVVRAPG